MALLSTIADRLVVRFTSQNKYESEFLRRYFLNKYEISIGMYSIGCFDRWRIPTGTKIGRYCSISASARLIDGNHPTRAISTHPYFYLKEFGVVDRDLLEIQPPVVEDDVWIGHNSIVTPECKRIGRGAIIGAGAVVMADVPRYAVMVGAPAKLVRYRFSADVIAAIEATEWWSLDRAELKAGLAAVPDFGARPTASAAEAFMAALGRP